MSSFQAQKHFAMELYSPACLFSKNRWCEACGCFLSLSLFIHGSKLISPQHKHLSHDRSKWKNIQNVVRLREGTCSVLVLHNICLCIISQVLFFYFLRLLTTKTPVVIDFGPEAARPLTVVCFKRWLPRSLRNKTRSIQCYMEGDKNPPHSQTHSSTHLLWGFWSWGLFILCSDLSLPPALLGSELYIQPESFPHRLIRCTQLVNLVL